MPQTKMAPYGSWRSPITSDLIVAQITVLSDVRLVGDETARPLCPMQAEFGMPQWNFDMSKYAFAGARRIACGYTKAGLGHLATLNGLTHRLTVQKNPPAYPTADLGDFRYFAWALWPSQCPEIVPISDSSTRRGLNNHDKTASCW
jgi:hypothetical protein